MWRDAESEIDRELDSGEKLMWCGQPRQGVMFRGHDIFLIPFSLLWGGFAIFWEIMALTSVLGTAEEVDGPVIIFPLFGIPFVLVGLYLMFGRFLVDSRGRRRTFYGLTDQRVILVWGQFSRKVKSMPLSNLTDVTMTEKADRRGTISFGSGPSLSGMMAGSGFPGMGKATAFEEIPDVKEVYQKIRDLQKP